ncbi:DUF397 domain-containing protein [Streptomyces sp. SCSIO ZS0520]|uniref:DUF397 domain-containing protein n=1 Tax=Streptomyces sp. SCSIO ZS0520 TaxID=2892996 RepID=UPI0021D9FF61
MSHVEDAATLSVTWWKSSASGAQGDCVEFGRMDAATLPVTWWKSSASGAQSDCVEFGLVDPEMVAVRDSKSPHGPALLLPRGPVTELITALKEGVL